MMLRALLCGLAGLAGAAMAPPAAEVEDFGWLSGAWASRDGEGWAEEYWTPLRGGIMIGAGITGHGKDATGFEHMRIVKGKGGAVAFHGMPDGAPAVAFPLARGGPGEAVFENPAHDYPQRISYRREGETLVATVSLIDGSRARSWTYRRVELQPSP